MSTYRGVKILFSIVIIGDIAASQVSHDFERRRQIAKTIVINNVLATFPISNPVRSLSGVIVQVHNGTFVDARSGRKRIAHKYAPKVRHVFCVFFKIGVEECPSWQVYEFFLDGEYGLKYSAIPFLRGERYRPFPPFLPRAMASTVSL